MRTTITARDAGVHDSFPTASSTIKNNNIFVLFEACNWENFVLTILARTSNIRIEILFEVYVAR